MLWFVLLHGAYAAIELQHLVTVTSDVGSEAVRICACVEDAQIHAFQFDNDAGYDIVGHEMLPDHAEVVDLGILQLRAEQIGARLAMTGKDAVKICEPHNSIIFEPEVVFDAGEEELRRVLWP